ncbi:MAG: 4-hydroxy-tetrahydrodipicolinate synthase [Gammaproteobacteria bacterium]
MFKGSMVAIITPMHKDGTIDKKSLHDLVEWHIASKTDGLVVAGTTGESTTLGAAEQADLIATVVKQVKQRIPVIAGSGSNSTQHALELTLNAKTAGADACLVVTPYYNKPTQNGLYEHYKFIAEKSQMPMILYNVPSRTACDLLPETVERLANITPIIGIKEATGKVERATEILKRCGDEFPIYSGDDATALDLMLLGAQGVISVTANVMPRKMHDLCVEAMAGNKAQAEKINADLMPLHTNLFLESNPIPTKWALYEMGLIESGIRLPLLPLDAKFHSQLKEAMRAAGALELDKNKIG